MSAFKLTIILTFLICLSACSSLNVREKVLRDVLIGAATGAALAQTKSDHKTAYTAIYAGIGAGLAATASVFINLADEDKIKLENEKMKIELSKYESQLKPQLVAKGNSLFNSPIPRDVTSLVDPGEWKRYKLDQWVQDSNSPNTWYRQVEMFEIIPPTSK